MMGDNRGDSQDSRFWGPVPRSWIIGGAFATYWPVLAASACSRRSLAPGSIRRCAAGSVVAALDDPSPSSPLLLCLVVPDPESPAGIATPPYPAPNVVAF